MASGANRRGGGREGDSRRARARSKGASRADAYRAVAGGAYRRAGQAGRTRPPSQAQGEGPGPRGARDDLSSVRVGDIRRAERNERVRQASARHARRIMAVLAVIVACVVAWAVAYNSSLFTITDVEVRGVEHLTSAEMSQLADVEAGETLLRVDAQAIRARLLQNAWVEDARVSRSFPNTLVIEVTERTVAAIVEIPGADAKSVKQWAIAEDHMWLMPIPSRESSAGQATSDKVYEDAQAALHITNVPYGTSAAIGQYCTDDNVNNALDIVSGLTTELSSRVVEVSASGTDETTLVLDNGVEIAFGKAEDIRDKERVVLQILEEYPDSVSYINVRSASKPTWRAV